MPLGKKLVIIELVVLHFLHPRLGRALCLFGRMFRINLMAANMNQQVFLHLACLFQLYL